MIFLTLTYKWDIFGDYQILYDRGGTCISNSFWIWPPFQPRKACCLALILIFEYSIFFSGEICLPVKETEKSRVKLLFVLASEKKVSDYVVLRTIKVEYLMSLSETFFLGLWGHEIKFSGVKKSSKSNRNRPMPFKVASSFFIVQLWIFLVQ